MTSTTGTGSWQAHGTIAGAVVAGWAGVLHVVLAMVPPYVLTREVDQPSWTDAPDAIVAFYAGARFDTAFMTGMLMEGASFALLLVILAKAADLVAGVDDGSRWIGWLIVGGAALEMAFGIFGYLGTLMAGVFRADHGGLSSAGYLVLHDLRFAFYWLDLVVLPLWMAPLGVAIIRTRFFPRWLGWAFLVNSIAVLPVLFLPVDLWTPAGGLPILWILVMAVLMIRRPERYSSGGHQSGETGRGS